MAIRRNSCPTLLRRVLITWDSDSLTDPPALQTIRGRTSVLGMLDPSGVLRRGNVDEVRQHTLDIMRVMAPDGGFLTGRVVPSARYTFCFHSYGHGLRENGRLLQSHGSLLSLTRRRVKLGGRKLKLRCSWPGGFRY